jgi:hypothetical protein
MTQEEEQVTSRRLQYCRTIVRNLARQRFTDPHWRLDQGTADSMKRLIRRMLGNSDTPVPRNDLHATSGDKSPQVEIPEQAEGCCTAHLLRSGERRAIYKEGLCRACYEGEPIKESETYGESFKAPEFGPEKPKRQRTESLMLAVTQLENALAAQFGREGREA